LSCKIKQRKKTWHVCTNAVTHRWWTWMSYLQDVFGQVIHLKITTVYALGLTSQKGNKTWHCSMYQWHLSYLCLLVINIGGALFGRGCCLSQTGLCHGTRLDRPRWMKSQPYSCCVNAVMPWMVKGHHHWASLTVAVWCHDAMDGKGSSSLSKHYSCCVNAMMPWMVKGHHHCAAETYNSMRSA